MDKHIKDALVMLLSKEMVVSSWGITHFSLGIGSCKFHVDGFCFTGFVEISYRRGVYQVAFDNEKVLESALEDLVEVLDAHIEKASSYEQRLSQWLSRHMR